jgi:RimJ/RimL family protein N-acetyltransferase
VIIHGIRVNEISDGVSIAAHSGTAFNPVVDQCIARVTSKGKLRGGVVYSGYTGQGGSIGMHVVGFDPLWINRDMLWMAFDYPFNQLGVKKVFGQVPASNQKALHFDLALGFKVEALVQDVFPDGDMILVAMYRDECRHLRIVPRATTKG